MVKFFVYLLTFANGKVYVGMSRTDAKGGWTTRYRAHAQTAVRGKALPIYSAWRKHGAPEQVVLSTHDDRAECALAEIEVIAMLDSTNRAKGYNLAPGGEGMHAPLGSAVYDLMRAKVWNNVERNARLSAAHKGRIPSPRALAASVAARATEQGRERMRQLVWENPTVRAKLSAATTAQMAKGGAEHLSRTTSGRPSPLTPDQRAAHSELMRARMNDPERQAQSRGTLARTLSNPGSAAKLEAGRAAWRASEANRENCRRIAKLSAAACSRPVRDDATGTEYPSQRAMAQALGLSDAAIAKRIKRGKVTRL